MDGLEELISPHEWTYYYKNYTKGKYVNQKRTTKKYKIIRYADDFVILCPTKEGLEEVKPIIEAWLHHRGLTLNEQKTKITRISEGFDFLSFNVRQFLGKTLRHESNEYKRLKKLDNPKTGKKSSPKAKPKGDDYFKCIIKPSKEKVKQLLKDLWILLKTKAPGMTWGNLLKLLNSKLRGWANYYSKVASKRAFSYIHHKVWAMLTKTLRRRHPNKGWKWITKRYFTTKDGNKWTHHGTLQDKSKSTVYLIDISKDIPITRHIKVKESNSTLDPKLKDYWSKRSKDNATKRFAKDSKYQKIFSIQEGICPICGLPIEEEESWNLHHIVPKKDGGSDEISNLVFLHEECHKAKNKNLHW